VTYSSQRHPLILALLDEEGWLLEKETPHIIEIDECEAQPGCYLTGQVVAAYIQVRLTAQDFGRPRKRDFAWLNLRLPACT
jgi:hypothetical protein